MEYQRKLAAAKQQLFTFVNQFTIEDLGLSPAQA